MVGTHLWSVWTKGKLASSSAQTLAIGTAGPDRGSGCCLASTHDALTTRKRQYSLHSRRPCLMMRRDAQVNIIFGSASRLCQHAEFARTSHHSSRQRSCVRWRRAWLCRRVSVCAVLSCLSLLSCCLHCMLKGSAGRSFKHVLTICLLGARRRTNLRSQTGCRWAHVVDVEGLYEKSR